MRRSLTWGLALMAAVGAPLAAQEPERPPRELRERVEGRFAERVKEALDLTDEQAKRLNETAAEHGKRRREWHEQERRLREALADQLRPGVAANQDSVARLTDALVALRTNQAQALRSEMAELAKFLTPVQRARLLIMRERFIGRARELRDRRPGGGRGFGGPGPGRPRGPGDPGAPGDFYGPGHD